MQPVTFKTVSAGGLAAWIQTESDVAKLFVARDGKVQLAKPLGLLDAADFGYEGCQALMLRWYGERLVAVSSEKGCYLRSIDPVSGAETGIHLNRAWLIDGDIVVWAGDDPGLISCAAAPLLDPLPPLPFRWAAGMRDYNIRIKKRDDGRLDVLDGVRLVDTLTPPAANSAGAPSAGELLAALTPHLPASPAARLAIEAAAYPFYRPAQWRNRWQPDPRWIPVYWYRHLRSQGRPADAAEFLKALGEIAGPSRDSSPELGWRRAWSPQEAWIHLALSHVRRQSRIAADVCRSGVLPPGTWCLLFDPAPGSRVAGSRVDPDRFPPILREAFERLAVANPEKLPHAL